MAGPDTVPAHAEVDADGRVIISAGGRRPGLHNLLWRERSPFWASTASAQTGETLPAAHAVDSLPPLKPLPLPPQRLGATQRQRVRPWLVWALLGWAVGATLAALASVALSKLHG